MSTPSAKIYAKTNCYSSYLRESSVAAKNYLVGDYYTSLYKFLDTLQTNGVTELVTMYTGSNGNGVGYWDEPTRFGDGCFSVWKFKPNGERTWEWYLYIHTNSGSTLGTYESTTNQVPTRIFGGQTTDGNNFRSVGIQAAICVSSSLVNSTSFNPWNGTTSLSGVTYKANPVWTSGSVTNSLFVFPRQNYLSGSSNSAKDNLAPSLRIWDGIQDSTIQWNFFSDGHGLLITRDLFSASRDPKLIGVEYVGPFRLSNGVTKSNPGNVLSGTGSLGFAMFNCYDWTGLVSSNTIPEGITIGQTGSITSSYDGGAMALINKGVRTFACSVDSASIITTRTAFTNRIEEYQINIYMSGESGFNGFVGKIDSPLLRVANGINTHDFSGSRAAWSSNKSGTGRGILTPWPTSSLPPGRTPEGFSRNRDGFSYVINDYSI